MSLTLQTTRYTLYHHRGCPFCALTRAALPYIDLTVEERDIEKHSRYRQELIEGGGKPQVPCLRIDNGQHTEWLYESKAIVQYLQRQQAAVTP